MTPPTPTRPEPTTPTRVYRPSDKELVYMCEGILLYQGLPAHLNVAVKAVTSALLERLLMAPSFAKQHLTSEPATPQSHDSNVMFHIAIMATAHQPDDAMFSISFKDLRRLNATIQALETELGRGREPAVSVPVPTPEIDQEQLASWLFKHFAGSNNDWSPTSCGLGLQMHYRQYAAKLVALLARSHDGRGG